MDNYEFTLVSQLKQPQAAPVVPIRKKVITLGTGLIGYIGYAKRGSLTSQAVWTVEKYTYTAGGDLDYTEVSAENQIMDNYLTLTYS